MSTALQKGMKLELCYAAGMVSSNPEVRKNVIQNAANIIRATRGRGIIISSEARSALGIRGPYDVINLGVIWGMSQDLATETVSLAPQAIIRVGSLRKESFRGAVKVTVVEHGAGGKLESNKKRKGDGLSNAEKQKLQKKASPEDKSMPVSSSSSKANGSMSVPLRNAESDGLSKES